MKITSITKTEFGRIVEEITVSKVDCAMTHIYINNLTKEAEDYLSNLVQTLPAEELQSYMVHWNDNTETLLGFFGEE